MDEDKKRTTKPKNGVQQNQNQSNPVNNEDQTGQDIVTNRFFLVFPDLTSDSALSAKM